MARFGRSFPVPRQRGVVAFPVVERLPTANLVASFSATNALSLRLPTAGAVAAFTATLSPVAIGESSYPLAATFMAATAVTIIDPTSGAFVASFSTALSPEAIGFPSYQLLATFATGAGLTLKLPSASLSASYTASASPSLALPTTSLSASFTAAWGVTGVTLPAQGLVSTFTAMTTGLAIGESMALVTSFTSTLLPTFPSPPSQLLALFGPSRLYYILTPPTANPGTIPLWISLQAMHRMGVGVGVPPTPMGNDGDFFFRKDGATGARVYARSGGSWSAVA